MELQQLKYFKTVAEVGKISAAAESLFISAPALSASVSRLEKELGMALFDRSGNSIRLNRQGQIFLRYVNQIFASLDCARVELRQSMMHQEQHVAVTTMSSNSWVDLIAAFSQEYPHFTLACTSQRLSQFEAVGLPPQFSFLLADDGKYPHILGDMERLPLFQDSLVAMVHPEHPVAKAGRVEPMTLLEETVFFPLPDYPLYERLQNSFAAAGISMPNGNSHSALVSRHMVADGLGVGITTAHTGKTLSEGLCYVPIIGMEQTWTVSLYWRRNRPLSEDEQQFLDFVERLYLRGVLQHKV